MFQVRIHNTALGKVTKHTRKPYEQIGVLIGTLEYGELVIYDAIEGEDGYNGTASIFPAKRLAKVAQDLIIGRLAGKIVGWYHSHIGCGIFMSEQDIQTQINLQQFSPYIVAMIIDPHIHEFGLFTISDNQVLQIPEEHIIIS